MSALSLPENISKDMRPFETVECSGFFFNQVACPKTMHCRIGVFMLEIPLKAISTNEYFELNFESPLINCL